MGALLYLSRHTRPDIAYPVNKLSRHQGHVTREIFSYARRIGRYVYNSRFLVIPYRAAKSENDRHVIHVFVDASHANEERNRSCSGFLTFHGDNMVHWGTRLQKLAVPSSTAAEIIAVTDVIDDILTLRFSLHEMQLSSGPALIYEDNISARTIFLRIVQ